ncbi:sialidase family protein [Flavobacterium sp. 3-210]
MLSSCSSEKDITSEKPPVSTDLTSKPTSYIGQDFTLLPENHVPDSDLYVEGGLLQNQENNAKYNKSLRTWQGIPSIGADKWGNLYSTWITGGKWEGNDNYITVSLSKDYGKSWKHDKLVIYTNPEDSTRVMDPSLFNDKFGNLYIAWAKHSDKKIIAKKQWAEVWYSKLKLAQETNTIEYSSPRRLAVGIMINKPFSSKITDQMIFPIAVWYAGNSILQQPFMYKGNYSANYLSPFTKVGGMKMNVSKQHMVYEHMFVELADSTYLGMTRTLDGIYYSKSKNGDVWDEAKKFTDLGATTSARFHLAKLQSGRLILIFNNATTRTNMTVCLSEDDGATWPYKMVIDSNTDISYPDMIETTPGVINITYDQSRVPPAIIHFVKIKESDIIANNNSGIFRTEISSLK